MGMAVPALGGGPHIDVSRLASWRMQGHDVDTVCWWTPVVYDVIYSFMSPYDLFPLQAGPFASQGLGKPGCLRGQVETAQVTGSEWPFSGLLHPNGRGTISYSSYLTRCDHDRPQGCGCSRWPGCMG